MRNRNLLAPPRNLDPHTRMADHVVENRTRVSAQERNTATARIALPFSASWGNYDAGTTWQPCYYYIDRSRVWLEGLAMPTAAHGGATTLATLPLGYRPPEGNIFAVLLNGTFARLDVNASGTIVVQSAAGAGSYLSISGISFRV